MNSDGAELRRFSSIGDSLLWGSEGALLHKHHHHKLWSITISHVGLSEVGEECPNVGSMTKDTEGVTLRLSSPKHAARRVPKGSMIKKQITP